MIQLPPRKFALSIVWRSLIIWIGVRAAVTAGAAAAAGGLTQLSLRVAFLLVLFTVALTVFDTIRRKERFFLANLGIPIGTVALLAAGPPVSLEVLLVVIAI